MSDTYASSIEFGGFSLLPALRTLYRALFASETVRDPRALAAVGLEGLI